MAIYYWYIKNTDPAFTDPKPKYVRFILQDKSWPEDDMWFIPKTHANNWVGTGHGKMEYEDGVLKMFCEDDDTTVRIKFFEIQYPEDCTTDESKTGPG